MTLIICFLINARGIKRVKPLILFQIRICFQLFYYSCFSYILFEAMVFLHTYLKWEKTQWLAKEFHSAAPVKKNQPNYVFLDLVSSNLCVQVDASYCQNSLATGYAAICRYADGKWHSGIAGKTTAIDALSAESMAIYHYLEWCHTNAWRDVTIVSDCQNAVLGINNVNSPPDKMTNIYAICREYLGKIEGGSLRNMPRQRVKDADHVARAARKRGEPNFSYVNIAPPPDVYGDLCNSNVAPFNFCADDFSPGEHVITHGTFCNFLI